MLELGLLSMSGGVLAKSRVAFVPWVKELSPVSGFSFLWATANVFMVDSEEVVCHRFETFLRTKVNLLQELGKLPFRLFQHAAGPAEILVTASLSLCYVQSYSTTGPNTG
jgi:hypothetical protein